MTSLAVLGASSCLVPDANYCALFYGDASCPEGNFCVLAKERASHEGVDNGCSAEVSEEFVHVRYGLPTQIDQTVRQQPAPRVVESLLDRLGYADCGSLDERRAHFGPVIGRVAAVRQHIQEAGRTRRAAAELTDDHVASILAFDEAFTAWVERCAEGPGTGTGPTTMGEEASATAGTEASSESSTAGPECMGNDECPGETPFCNPETMTCVVDCDGMPDPNAACAGMSPETPVCLDGVCVQCTPELPDACTGMTPVCDAEMNTCVPCTAHEQCGDAACNLFTGACLPADQVVHVGPGQTFATLTAAASSFDGMEGTVVVHAGPPDYNESLTLNDGQVIAFLAADLGPGIEPPVWIRTSGNTPQLTVSTGATVLLDGMQLATNASSMVPGVRVDGGQAWLDRSRIVANIGGGILAQADATLVLRNCFVGGSVNNVPALELDGANARLVHTTVGAGFGAAPALLCGALATADVRNSLFVAETDDPEVDCPGATIEHSAAEMSLGGTNTDLLDMSTSWFANYGAGDFHLAPSAPSAIDTTALWLLGDPPTDIDGDPRPTRDGTPDFAGADVP